MFKRVFGKQEKNFAKHFPNRINYHQPHFISDFICSTFIIDKWIQFIFSHPFCYLMEIRQLLLNSASLLLYWNYARVAFSIARCGRIKSLCFLGQFSYKQVTSLSFCKGILRARFLFYSILLGFPNRAVPETVTDSLNVVKINTLISSVSW